MSYPTVEILVRRNGVYVSRQIRDLAALGNADGGQIPAPRHGLSDWSVNLREEIVDLMLEALNKGDDGFASLRSIGSLMAWRNQLSDATLDAYRTTIRNRPSDGFADLLVGVMNEYEDDMTAAYILEIAKLNPGQDYSSPRADHYGKGDRAYRTARAIFNGLQYYGEAGYTRPPTVLDHTDVAMVQTLALARFTHRIRESNNGLGMDSFFPDDVSHRSYVTHVDSMDLVKMVLANPDDVDRIAEVVLQRQSTDIVLIAEVLASPVPAFSDGVL